MKAFLSKEFSSTHEAAVLLAVFSLFSQILALVRDKLLAYMFGAGAVLDTYYAAFRVPDLIYALLASAFASVVIVPTLMGIVEEKGEESMRRFSGAIFKAFFVLMCAVSVILFFLMPYIVPFSAPGFTAAAQSDVVMLSRILLLSPLLLGLSNLFGSVAQMRRHFWFVAMAPVFYNIGIIAGIVLLYPVLGLSGLAWGVALGALLHLFTQGTEARRSPAAPDFSAPLSFKELRGLFKISLPRMFTLSLSQILLLCFTAIASTLSLGSVAIFTFAFNLQSVPLALIGMSYSTAAFPSLSSFFAKKDKIGFSKEMHSALAQIIFWSVVVTCFFIVLRAHIVRVILGAGAFSWNDTRLTAAALAVFIFSILAQNAMMLFTRGYYALKDTKTPLLLHGFSSVVSVGFAFLFLYLFKTAESFRFFIDDLLRVDGVQGTAVLMLPLAYSVGAIMGAVLLSFDLARKNFLSLKNIYKTFLQVFGASLLGAYASYLFLDSLSGPFGLTTFWGVFGQGAVAGIGGAAISALFLIVLDNAEFKRILTVFRHKFWRGRALVPEQTEL